MDDFEFVVNNQSVKNTHWFVYANHIVELKFTTNRNFLIQLKPRRTG